MPKVGVKGLLAFLVARYVYLLHTAGKQMWTTGKLRGWSWDVHDLDGGLPVCGIQDEYDAVEAQYKIEKDQLAELETRFEPLDAEFKTILEERDVTYRMRLAGEREVVRRYMAALALQAWWRSYRVRKACQIAAKKRAKAASKGMKSKGGKGKKKGKKEGEESKPTEAAQPEQAVAKTE